MKPSIRIAFVDFYPGFDVEGHHLPRLLRRHFNVIIDNKAPDVCVYSCFGTNNLRYKDCLRIFYSGENVVPDFNSCDFAISTVRCDMGRRHLYLPQYAVTALTLKHIAPLPPVSPEMAQRDFCSFIYSSVNGSGGALRQQFCRKLSEYKHVACPGRVLHNMEAPELSARYDENWHLSKIQFLGRYKFNIAFENSNASGYISEKLIDAFLGNTIPIYWGSDGNIAPFTRDAMIVANDYENPDELVERVREVDEDSELYLRMLAANPLRHGLQVDPEKELEDFLIHSVQQPPFEKDPYCFSTTAQLVQSCKLMKGLPLALLDVLTGVGYCVTCGRYREYFRKRRAMLHTLRNCL